MTNILEIAVTSHHQWEFTKTEDFKRWAENKPPEFNAFAYLDMIKERRHATRLEF